MSKVYAIQEASGNLAVVAGDSERLAKILAGIDSENDKNEIVDELGDYFERVFNVK